MTPTKNVRAVAAALAVATIAGAATAGAPHYNIIDLGVVSSGDSVQGNGISAGGVAFGRTLGSNRAFSWTQGGGLVTLGTVAGRNFFTATAANDAGQVVGVGTTTSFGSGAVPIVWNNGVATQLAFGSGFDVGRAYGVNNNGMVVGSQGGGVSERATIWNDGFAQTINTTTAGGAYMTTAYAVNDAGMIAGIGIDPNNLARNVAILYDSVNDVAIEIPSLADDNGGIAFNMSQTGYVVGSSSFNQSGSSPFIWSMFGGTVEIPLTPDASQGSARGVNSDGWVVGTGSGLYAVPFLFDGTDTYRLQDLIDAGTGWDISTNTFSSGMGISDDGTIVGTGVFNGQIRAYAMVLVPAPGVTGLLALSGLVAARRRR